MTEVYKFFQECDFCFWNRTQMLQKCNKNGENIIQDYLSANWQNSCEKNLETRCITFTNVCSY